MSCCISQHHAQCEKHDRLEAKLAKIGELLARELMFGDSGYSVEYLQNVLGVLADRVDQAHCRMVVIEGDLGI